MNTNTFIVGAIALVVGLGAGYFFAGERQSEAGSHDMHGTMADMTSGLEGKSGAEFEEAFIDEMIAHHEGAVSMAQMVLQKSSRPELVKLANDIISAQTSEIDMMKTWKAQWFSAQ